MTWRDDAACAGMTFAQAMATFYPTGSTAESRWNAARALCEGCPVRNQCLDAALTEELADAARYEGKVYSFGYRGGTTPAERALIHDQRYARPQRKLGGTHCPNGHEYTPDNTYIRPDTNTRTCRTCVRNRLRRSEERTA